MRVTLLVLTLITLNVIGGLPVEPVWAIQGNGFGVQVFPGLDGFCREGDWFPVRVVLENSSGHLEGEIQITASQPGDPNVIYAVQFSAPTGSRKSYTIMAFAGSYLTELEALIIVNGQILSSTPFRITCLTPQDLLFGVVADQSTPFNVLIDLDPPGGSAHLAQLSLDDISPSPYAFEALDGLLISGTETSSLNSEQVAGIAQWVASGGDLLLTGGPRWDTTLPAFQDLLPFDPQGTMRIPALPQLAQAIGLEEKLAGESFITTGEIKPGAEIIAQVDRAPILIQQKFGAGSVTVLTVDPTLDPVRGWSGIIDVYRLIFTSSHARASWSSGLRSWEFAREAVSTIPGLDLPPFAWICGVLLVYIIVIGPLNYWLLRRWARREFAWISIPIVVIIFTFLTFTVGRNTRGNLPILNRLAVVQSWPETRFARVDSLIGVFSPDRASYTLELLNGFAPFAVPEIYQSGFDAFTFVQTPSNTIIPKVQVETGGIEVFGANGRIAAPNVQSTLQLNLGNSDTALNGIVTLPTNLPLLEAVLLAPDAVQRLGDLQGGELVQVDLSLNDSPTRQNPRSNPARFAPTSNTVEAILGTSYYAGFNNPEISMKFALLNALMDPYDRRIVRGFGVYLVGWSDRPMIPVGLAEADFEALDLTLHLIKLPLQIVYPTGEPFTIPPGLFQWESMDLNNPQPNGPYAFYLDAGRQLQMKYNLKAAINYSEAVALNLHLEGDQNSSNAPVISIWDFTEENWTKIPTSWGSISIPQPTPFVTDQGEIRLLVENSAVQTGTYIERLDISLKVMP